MVTLKELHEFAVEQGIEQDPRDKKQIDDLLEDREEAFEGLDGVREEKFDKNRLENPFDDSKVLFGGDEEVSKIAIGIDMETQELLLVDRLNEKGEDIDGVITHHPEGKSLARLHAVMPLQVDTLYEEGVPISQAEAVVRPRVNEVKQGVHGINHPRAPKTAELLGLPFASMHTITDNFAHQYVKDYLEEEDPRTLNDLVDALLEIEEYQWALEHEMGPQIFVGNGDNRVGNLAFDFTGGTELDKERLETMATSGVNTIVAMHMSRSQIKEAEKQNINVVSAGHMSSDSLGMNLLLDEMQDKYDIEVVEMSGFKRVER